MLGSLDCGGFNNPANQIMMAKCACAAECALEWGSRRQPAVACSPMEAVLFGLYGTGDDEVIRRFLEGDWIPHVD